jgi:predicted  nucleic acid-binding Zn-ribbon protein
MSPDLIVASVVGMAGVAMTLFALTSARRANRAQADSARVDVEAGAYSRARESYEDALSTLRASMDDLRQEVTRLRVSNDGLAREVLALQEEIHRLRS